MNSSADKKKLQIKKFIFLCLVSFTLISSFPNIALCLTVTSAELEINCDDEFYVYINGALAFETQSISGTDWEHVYTIDVSSFFFCGDYVMAINYYDTLSAMMSLTYKLTLHIDDGSTMYIYSDGIGEKQITNGNFLSSTQVFPPGWNTFGFDDSAWNDTVYVCTGSRITDTAFASGFVPNIAEYSGCGIPIAGQSQLLREKFNILCPLVNISKTINKNIVALGETITYCFNYSNTDAAPWTFVLWDTIPAVTDYVGCNSGCTTQVYGSDVVVSWPITVAPGGSGSVCMWVAANRYPMLLEQRGLCVLPAEEKNNRILADGRMSP